MDAHIHLLVLLLKHGNGNTESSIYRKPNLAISAHVPLFLDATPSSCGSGVMGLGSGGRGLERDPPPVTTAGGLPVWLLEEPPPCPDDVIVVAPFLALVSSMSRGRLASPRKECSFFLLSLALRGGSSPSSSLSLYSSSRLIRLSRCCSAHILHVCMGVCSAHILHVCMGVCSAHILCMGVCGSR